MDKFMKGFGHVWGDGFYEITGMFIGAVVVGIVLISLVVITVQVIRYGYKLIKKFRTKISKKI